MTEANFTIHGSIPVLRMLNEAAAKAFYLDFLGYVINWEHRFRDDPKSPLYLQVNLGESVLHLNGHAEADAPTSEVRIPVVGVQAFCQWLGTRTPDGQEPPEVVDPRYEGKPTDLNLADPSGNTLTFWEREA